MLIIISVNISFAQRTISGSITDVVSGEALIGIVIHIPNTKINTQTDFQGFYNLNIPNDATELIIAPTENYPGQTVSIGTNDKVDIALKEKVLIGYGKQKKEAITSAIVEVERSAFNQGVIADPALLLQGKVAGLQIYKRGGDPNRQSTIRLRGLSSGSFIPTADSD